MSDTVLVAMIVAIPPTIGAIAAYLQSRRNTALAEQTKFMAEQASNRGNKIMEDTAAMRQALVRVRRLAAVAAARTAGREEGRVSERARTSSRRKEDK